MPHIDDAQECISAAAYLTPSWANLNNSPFFCWVTFQMVWDLKVRHREVRGAPGPAGGQSLETHHQVQGEDGSMHWDSVSCTVQLQFLLLSLFILNKNWTGINPTEDCPDRSAAQCSSVASCASIAEAFKEQKQEWASRDKDALLPKKYIA